MRATRLLVDVPVQTVVLQDEPVLLPLVRKITLSVSLPPQPALTVSSTQSFAGNTSTTQGRQTPPCNDTERNHGETERRRESGTSGVAQEHLIQHRQIKVSSSSHQNLTRVQSKSSQCHTQDQSKKTNLNSSLSQVESEHSACSLLVESQSSPSLETNPA